VNGALLRKLSLTATAAALGLALTACGGSSDPGQQAQAPARTLTVSAAASLTSAYQQLGTEFQAANPGTTVTFNFGGSDSLAQQVVQGAPADVLATASSKTMQTAVQAGKIQDEPVIYATNSLQIAVAPNNPKAIASLADLAKPGVVSVVCAPAVPCGAAAEAAEKAANVTLTPASEEQDVKGVLNRVQTGNADAGLVYVTDVNAAKGQVQGVSFPESSAAKTNYPIAVVKNAPQADLAQKWVQLVEGETGQKTLEAQGFGAA